MTTADSNRNKATPGRSVSDAASAEVVRVVVVGNVDAGKSTLIGTLTTQHLDDGNGRARSLIMRHAHECESGRTSTVSANLLGFKANGETISYAAGSSVGGKKFRAKHEELIGREADRIISLTDLAGHEKYLKTTIYGVAKGFADYALILVNARQPPTHMTLQHLNLCSAFGIPVILVLTKMDGCPQHVLKNTTADVTDMLLSPEVGRRPFTVRSQRDIETVKDKTSALAPVVMVSSVTGEGIDLLRELLLVLPRRRRHEKKQGRPFEFLVEEVLNVTGVGSVVSGFVNAGHLTIGETVNVGPLEDGRFIETTTKSAHVARNFVDKIVAGNDACLALALTKEQRKMLRRGMVVLREPIDPTRRFEAEICVLKGEGTTIQVNYVTYVHILHVRQTSRVTDIEVLDYRHFPTARFGGDVGDGKVVLRPGCRARVTFEFLHRPEYVRNGMRIVFRDGRLRGVGAVTKILTKEATTGE